MNRSYNEFDSFDSAFICLSRELVGIDTQDPKAGSYISFPRDQEVREILAKAFVINNPRHRITGVPARKFSLEYLAAELVWYFSGHNTCDWIERHASFWSQIQNSDGTINSAYGDRIFNRGMLKGGPRTVVGKLDRNQWQMVLDELRKDPSSRRAVMHIKTIDDGFDEKDVPCTLTLQFLIREGALNMVVHMRSNDLVLGACYDVPAFTLMQEVMANDLGVKVGCYYHFANSMHVYSRHYGMARAAATEDLHLVRTSNGSKNVPMNSLESHVTIDAIRQWAAELYCADNELERCVTEFTNAKEFVAQAKKTIDVIVSCSDIGLIRDIARLLCTSAIKRAAKNRDSDIKEELMKARADMHNNLEDPSFRACVR